MSHHAISHTQYVLINRLSMPLGSLITLILIGQHSDVLLGGYAVSMTFYYIMQMLPLLGLTSYVMREVARHPQHAGDYFNTVGLMSICGCIIVDIAVFLSLPYTNYSNELTQSIHVVGLLIFPGILVFIAEIIFMSLNDAKPIAIIAVIENLARVLLSVTVLILDPSLSALIWVYAATRTASLIAYIIILVKKNHLKRLGIPNWPLFHQTLVVLPSFLIGAVLFIILSRMDFLVLSLYESITEIAYYAVSFRLYDLGILFLTAIIMAIFPWVSKKFLGSSVHYRTAIINIVLFLNIVNN